MTGNVVLMDLAGSEEPPRDVTVEQKRDKRFQEGVEINKSLTALRSYVDELIVKKTSTNRPTSRRGHGALNLLELASMPMPEHLVRNTFLYMLFNICTYVLVFGVCWSISSAGCRNMS